MFPIASSFLLNQQKKKNNLSPVPYLHKKPIFHEALQVPSPSLFLSADLTFLIQFGETWFVQSEKKILF